MKRKAVWLMLGAIVAGLLGVLGAAIWLLMTESGLQWTYATLRTRLPGTLELRALAGRLAGPLTIDGLHYRDTSVNVEVEHATLNWSPLALLVGRVQLGELTVNGVRISLAPTADKSSAPPSLSLPVSVRLQNATLRDIEVRRGDAVYRLQSIALATHINNTRMRIDHLTVDADMFAVSAQGTLGLAADNERLTVDWRVNLDGHPPLAGHGDITGRLADLSLTQQLTQPIAADVHLKLKDALTALRWQAEAKVPAFDWQRLQPDGMTATLGLTLAASGDRDNFKADGTLQARPADLPETRGRFRLHGAMTQEIIVDELALQLPSTKTTVTAQGRWQLPKQALDAHLQWHQLSWPLTDAPVISSPDGRLDISGTLANYRLSLNAKTNGAQLPDAHWQATGSGDRAHIGFDAVAVDILGGSVNGTAQLAWSPQLQWSAQLQGQSLNPAVTWPEWPGMLALTAQLAGDHDEIRGTVQQLRGTLRNRPVTGEARVTRRDDRYPDVALKLKSGDATVDVNGSIGNNWDLAWRVHAPELGAALPRASGRLDGNGHVGGTRATPYIEAKLNGSGLAYGQTRTEKIDIDTAIDLSDRVRSYLKLNATGLSVAGRDVDRLSVDGDGKLTQHTLTISAHAAEVTLNAQLNGRYADTVWNGALSDSTLHIGTEDWKLVNRAPLLLSAERIKLDESCWQLAAARVCTHVDRNDTGTELGLIAERMPLALFNPLMRTPIGLAGSASGRAQARIDANDRIKTDARFDFGPGSVTYLAAGATLAYERAHLDLTINDNGLRTNAEFALANGDGGSASVALPKFSIDGGDQPVEGKFSLALRTLAPFAALFPELEDLHGNLHADLTLLGTLARPRVRGQATLADASARLPTIGIHVDDTQLTATPLANGNIQLNGHASSGGGTLGLSGLITLKSGLDWQTDLRIAGARFLTADLPEAKVYVSPDLRFVLTPNAVKATGDVHIPEARFTLSGKKSEDAVTVSHDVVIVNAPTQVQAQVPARDPLPVTAEVHVTLGDKVSFDGFGLHAMITGSVVAIDAPGQLTTARGELRVTEGKYEAFGEKLDLERGRLLFVGPVDNPGIDARAVRVIDDTNTITVGVEVQGTLQTPELKLFSDPSMSQTDTLSYLLFGKPATGADAGEGRAIAAATRALKLSGGARVAQWLGERFGIDEVDVESSNTSEEAALVLGKRLSPRLYINYSIGLFGQANIFRIRYKLNSNWSLEAQSGTVSGGDVLYEIER
ncbi:MAG: translocation/assembly module TamB domain-containing protein [Gammaproteobacteria bacterium]|nr:translocation/assembly module TamB domain-containing protein [Gammaproteobacteria bacterium]